LYIYAAYLKKIPLAGNLVVSALMGFVFVLLMLFEVTFLNTISFEGANYVLDMLLWQVKFYGGFVVLMCLACLIVKDIADVEADEEHKINTLAVQFGTTAAKVIVSVVLVGLLAGMAFFMRGFLQANAIKEFAYMCIAVVVPVVAAVVLLFMAKEQKQYARVSMLLKVIMLLGILSIPAFYMFNRIAAN
jgi:4-hydroxybenzoate polyprenyltransferase